MDIGKHMQMPHITVKEFKLFKYNFQFNNENNSDKNFLFPNLLTSLVNYGSRKEAKAIIFIF